MKYYSVLLLLNFFLCLQFSKVVNAQSKSLEPKIDEYLMPLLQGNNYSGSILIYKNQQTIFSKGYGLANRTFGIPNAPLTKFHIASLSKSFTAAAVLILEEKGLIQLDHSITKYLPELSSFKKISIHHLLNHHSGIPDINRTSGFNDLQMKHQTARSLVDVIKEMELFLEPGEKYSYSNSNYNILARLIEVVSGLEYGVFLKKNIFDPIGLKHTGHHRHMGQLIENLATGYVPAGGYTSIENTPYIDWSVKTGNGSLYSTTEDLLKWVTALMNGKVLPKQRVEKMIDEGYGWFVSEKAGEKAIYYNGNSPGVSSFIGYFPEKNTTIIVLGNNHIGLATTIGEGLAALIFEKELEPFKARTSIKINQGYIDSTVGVFKFPNYTFEIASRNGFLVGTGGYPFYDVSIIPISQDVLFNRFFWTNLVIERDQNGLAKQIYWEYNPRMKGVRVP